MKLTIFQSDKGDCFLLTDRADKHRVLCDGGMSSTMKQYVRAELAALRNAGKPLDLVYVSHIDQDHISGVLQLLEDEVRWRVYDHHQSTGDPIAAPDVPRPPEIKGILHNAFRDQITENTDDIEDLLAAAVPTLLATNVPELVEVADEIRDIATSIPEAIRVSRLAKADALDIPINKPPGAEGPAKLLMAGAPNETFKVGTLEFTLIGPTDVELENLRDGWQNWLRKNKPKVKDLRVKLKKQIDEFSAGALAGSPFDLGDWNGIPDYKGVTPPNVASLMYLVEEGGKTLLLTGDGHQDHILAGLERCGKLAEDGGVHLDVLKVQHHGSDHNLDWRFVRRVSATHYVFGANGDSGNPDDAVLDAIWASRFGDDHDRLALAAPDDEEVHFWFSTTSAMVPVGTKRTRFRKIEQKVRKLADDSGGKLVLHFNEAASIELAI